MTALLERAFAEAGRLSSDEQDLLASRVLAELADEDEFDRAIAASADNVKPGMSSRLRKLGLVNEGEWVLAILAVHGEPPAVTANLAGPLVIDMEKATARQLVVEDPDFPLQAPVSKEG